VREHLALGRSSGAILEYEGKCLNTHVGLVENLGDVPHCKDLVSPRGYHISGWREGNRPFDVIFRHFVEFLDLLVLKTVLRKLEVSLNVLSH